MRGQKILRWFFESWRSSKGEGVRSSPLQGRSPDLKFAEAKNFEVIFLKVEEVRRGRGYVHAPFRGGTQIQNLWGAKYWGDFYFFCQLINKSINQVNNSINQVNNSINKSTSQLTNQQVNQPSQQVNQPIIIQSTNHKSINQSTSRSTNQQVNQPINKSINQSTSIIHRIFNRPTSHLHIIVKATEQ